MITMQFHKSDLDKEYKIAVKHIKQANRGGDWPVKICKDYKLFFESDRNYLTLQISYTDCDLRQQYYNIAM